MKNRINELAIKAGGVWQGGYVEQANGDSVYTDKKFVHGGDMDVEQFARLLVEECMELALSEQKRYANFTHRNLSECAVTMSNFRLLMKDHFGVKK